MQARDLDELEAGLLERCAEALRRARASGVTTEEVEGAREGLAAAQESAWRLRVADRRLGVRVSAPDLWETLRGWLFPAAGGEELDPVQATEHRRSAPDARAIPKSMSLTRPLTDTIRFDGFMSR